MDYEYGGYLSTILYAPDPDAWRHTANIEFSADDLVRWTTKDLASDREWRSIPALRKSTGEGVLLSGRFEDERRIDTLSSDDPSFWAPLGSIDGHDGRFPIDLSEHNVAEVTYRCTSDNAHPAIVWTYPGGQNLTFLPRTRRWRTVVMRLQHFGFPGQIDAFVFRLYSTARQTESMEVARLRFRGMTEAEREASRKDEVRLFKSEKPPHYPLLDEFIPIGTYVDAATGRRMASMLGIGLGEYWDLVFEDMVKHHHNSIVLENFERLTHAEWQDVLGRAIRFGLRVLPMQDLPLGDDPALLDEFIATWIAPYADSQALLAWSLCTEPDEHQFAQIMAAKAKVHAADPNHPLAVITRHPSGYPLFAPFLAAAGINHYTSHAPWQMADLVRTHAGLGAGQQFWISAPAFTWATGTPEWNSCPEMRIMAQSAFANGARGWLSYAYHNDPIWLSGSCMRTLTGPFLAFSDLWLELDQCMERLGALLPLFHNTVPTRLPKRWYAWSTRSGDHYEFPEGVPPTSSYRLRGPDYNLYFIISNDIRGMATVTINIPPEVMTGLEIYDISDFVDTRVWAPMRLERHLQMVPGQARVLLVAEAHVCAYWRDVIASRIVDNYNRQTQFNLALARAYRLPIQDIESLLDVDSEPDMLARLSRMERAYYNLQNLIYSHDPIVQARSRIIEAMSAACACDGALCRMIRRGKIARARELGEDVIPLAREFTNLRLELQNGHGAQILGHCEDLSNRAQRLLNTIRDAV